MTEITPFVKDSHYCIYCKSEAEYKCPYCKSLGLQQNVCIECSKETNKGLYCPRCNGKLAKISPRFVGSYRPMLKKNQNMQHKVMVKPNIHGIDERDNRLTRDEL